MAKSTKINITTNRISAIELADVIKMNVTCLKDNPEMAKEIPPLFVWGAPGIGKSTICRKVAEELGIGFRDVRLAEMDSVDIRGLPSVDKEKKTMCWNPPDFWPREKESRGILFLDECSACPRNVQVAAYEIILDRKLGEFYKVPDGWYIVAAGNRIEDRAVAMAMSSALANRFMHVELGENAEEWSQWAIANHINPSVCGFIRFRPELLFTQENQNLERGWPSPRSWEKVSHVLDISEKNKVKNALISKLVYGLIGAGVGAEFMNFYKTHIDFESVLDFMKDPTRPIPAIPDSADRKYALCSAIIYHLWNTDDENDQTNRLTAFFKILEVLPSDFATMTMVDAMSTGDHRTIADSRRSTLLTHPMYITWAKKHGAEMKKHIMRG